MIIIIMTDAAVDRKFVNANSGLPHEFDPFERSGTECDAGRRQRAIDDGGGPWRRAAATAACSQRPRTTATQRQRGCQSVVVEHGVDADKMRR